MGPMGLFFALRAARHGLCNVLLPLLAPVFVRSSPGVAVAIMTRLHVRSTEACVFLLSPSEKKHRARPAPGDRKPYVWVEG